MKHKLKIGVSKKSPKSNIVTYKKISSEVKVKNLIDDSNKVTIIVPGDSVKSVTIEETKVGETLTEAGYEPYQAKKLLGITELIRKLGKE